MSGCAPRYPPNGGYKGDFCEMLLSKLQIPPVRADRVLRLLERLNSGRAITLVTAPAGFGKTTLLSAWTRTLDAPAAWVSLEETETNAALFWQYIFGGLDSIFPISDLMDAACSALASGEPIEIVLTPLLNHLTEREIQAVLVLDDFHDVQTPEILRGLGYLMGHLPHGLRLVIATREMPKIAQLARLRAAGKVTTLTVEDLRFTADETRAFFDGAGLTEAELDTLQRYTDGWIAGLSLFGLALETTPDRAAFLNAVSANHHAIVDYLMEEVLRHQSDEVCDFLMRTSAVCDLNADICSRLVADKTPAECQAMLEYLERHNLFLLPLDSERRGYRYVCLFSDFMYERLRRVDPGLFAEINKRAENLPTDKSDPLTACEQDILRLLAEGKSNAEIAHTLIVAESTVKTHLKHIYRKLNVASRVQAVNAVRAL